MISYFVFFFSAAVCFWAGVHFLHAWRKSRYDPHWEFAMFMFVMGAGYLFPAFFLFVRDPGLITFCSEMVTFFILLSFAFVLRALVQFQGVSLSPNLITVIVAIAALARLLADLQFPSTPMVQDGLIYFRYPQFNHVTYIILLLLYTLAMAATFFSNLQNIRASRIPFLYLGSAFVIGGLSGVFITAFDTFVPVLSGYILFFLAFLLVILFLKTSGSPEETGDHIRPAT